MGAANGRRSKRVTNVYQMIGGTKPVKVNSNPITTDQLSRYHGPCRNPRAIPGHGGECFVGRIADRGQQLSVNLAGTSTAPAAPAIQQADGSSGTQVSLSWTASAGATSYIVLREDPGQSSFTQIASNLTTTTFADMNVTGGLTYQYQVEAKNNNGVSSPSATAQATVAQTLTAPATPANFQVSSASTSGVVLTWDASTGATSYTIAREDPGSSTFTPILPAVTVTNFTDTTVTAGSTYQYEVEASNSAGSSAFSAPVQAPIPVNGPATPTNLQQSTASGTSVVLTWDAAAGATSYIVDREDPGASTLRGKSPQGWLSRLTPIRQSRRGRAINMKSCPQNGSGTSAPTRSDDRRRPRPARVARCPHRKGPPPSLSSSSTTTVPTRPFG